MVRIVKNFNTLKNYTRVPKYFRKMVRNSKDITFIYPSKESFRVVNKNSKHYDFIKKFGILYSTSANENGKKFDFDFATSKCDVQLIDSKEYAEKSPSSIMKLKKLKIIKIR
ncbi:TsaC protein (YrdC domain) required for threonylcarbamoyladenosine t(6)A37 modification in tRNA [hydrothermal vent metagenome]|uniref:TsaC protein (YrdC domain) required for threonylcarbamoyladenosine t(6)A37 modification in tRNA n=1 Tax=hydrothermal vent metagenome TaxID=652676 RepID=A0A3B1DRJ7_9ZZZZ